MGGSSGSGGNQSSSPRPAWIESVLSWLVSDSPRAPSPPDHDDRDRELSVAHYGVPSSARTLARHQSDDDSPRAHAQTAAAHVAEKWSSCAISTAWLGLALLLLLLAVFAGETYLDSKVHSARLALLQLPKGRPGFNFATVTDGAVGPLDPTLPLSATGAAAAGASGSDLAPSSIPDIGADFHPLSYESLIGLQELLVRSQKSLNERLGEVHDRDSRIHSLKEQLRNREMRLAQYKVVVARLKALQVEHEEMERQAYAAAAARGNGIPLLTGLDPAAVGAGGGAAVAPAIDLAKYKDRLLALIFGNKTLEESRRDRGGGLLSLPDEHADEIAKLVREEREAQAGQRGGFLPRRGGHGRDSELSVESVMRVSADDDNPAGGDGDAESKSSLPAEKLVDAEKNEYILSKPGPDSQGKAVDVRLVTDLGVVIVASALGGLLASALRQPILLGYLLGGSAIGPGGAHLIGQFIQIETLAAFGATFLLFALGVEFSVSKLRKVKHIALLGGAAQLLAVTAAVSVVGVYLLELRLKAAVFSGAVLSMSSTTVVVKSLMSSRQIATLCGQVMLGLLIVQDLFLSLMLALLNLARAPLDRLAEESLWLFARFFVLGSVVLVCMYLWPICLRMLDAAKSPDLFLLGLVALCVFLTVVSEKVIHSAEVGAFLSGILISSSPGASAELTHRSLKIFGPIRDMFGALFFCSIGMLIDPFFLVERAATIAMLVAATVVLKSIIMLSIVRAFGYSMEIAVRAGLGLSQVGEFAFVLASEGVATGVLSKEQYHLLAATTAVSLVVTPSAFRLAMWIVKYFKLEDRKVHAQGMQSD